MGFLDVILISMKFLKERTKEVKVAISYEWLVVSEE